MPEAEAVPVAASPFAACTGRGIRVAVIDSGVHPRHPHIGRIAGGVAVAPDGRIDEGDGAWLDRLGHGTAVTAAIQEKAPDADCFVVKVFDTALRTTGAALIAAIDWCAANDIDVANLSLGSANAKHEEAFRMAADRALAAGVILVAAHAAEGQACYPGRLPRVIGVDVDETCPRETYRWDGAAGAEVFYASGQPRPIPGVDPSRNLMGVSFAVANMTGFAARACEAVGTEGRGAGRLVAVVGALKLELP